MDPITLATLGMGLAGSIGKMFGRGAANKRMESLLGRMPGYQIDESIKKRLGLAQTLLNARMPGAAQAEKNIYQTQANQVAQAERAATDPNQLLLAGAGAAGQSQQAFNALSQQEMADAQRRYGNLVSAEDAMNLEKQKEFQDRMNRYQMETQIKAAEQENRQNNWGDIANLGFTGAMLGQQGMFKGLLGDGSRAVAKRMNNLQPMVPNMGGFRGALSDSYNPTAVSNMMNIGIPQPNMEGFRGALPFPNQSIPQYLNPMTSPYQPMAPSQWWLGKL
jgi:hypothetical protein